MNATELWSEAKEQHSDMALDGKVCALWNKRKLAITATTSVHASMRACIHRVGKFLSTVTATDRLTEHAIELLVADKKDFAPLSSLHPPLCPHSLIGCVLLHRCHGTPLL